MSSSPKEWGPSAWYLIHNITRNLVKHPPSKKKKLKYQMALENFLYSLANIIPCPKCQKHYLEKLKLTPFRHHLDNWTDVDKWTFELHNNINKMLNKPEITYPRYCKLYDRPHVKEKLMLFPEIIANVNLNENMSLSEIQKVKSFLDALVVLCPLKKNISNKGVKNICDYAGLNTFYKDLMSC